MGNGYRWSSSKKDNLTTKLDKLGFCEISKFSYYRGEYLIKWKAVKIDNVVKHRWAIYKTEELLYIAKDQDDLLVNLVQYSSK